MADTAHDAARRVDALALAFEQPLADADLLDAGNFAMAIVLGRTKKGIDADGFIFAPYSNSYAQKKINANHNPFPVSLTWTGHMLGAMAVNLDGQGGVMVHIPVVAEAQKADWNQRGFNGSTAMRRQVGGAKWSYSVKRPPRVFLDIRMLKEREAIASILGERMGVTIERFTNGAMHT